MEELVIITMVTVIKLTYRQNSMEKRKTEQKQTNKQTKKQRNLT